LLDGVGDILPRLVRVNVHEQPLGFLPRLLHFARLHHSVKRGGVNM
jgi:hypothetical protein